MLSYACKTLRFGGGNTIRIQLRDDSTTKSQHPEQQYTEYLPQLGNIRIVEIRAQILI